MRKGMAADQKRDRSERRGLGLARESDARMVTTLMPR